MIIYPAIDLRKGRCVRLRQGDPDAETVFGEDPAEMARHWVRYGAEWLHVVNLDGAFGASRAHLNTLNRPSNILVQHPGSDQPESRESELSRSLPINLQRLREIRKAVDIPIQFGGGLRSMDDIRLALALGASRVVLGTVAVRNPQLVADALDMWGPERIVVGIDARAGKVATHGWQETSDVDAVDLGHSMQAMGVERVVYTDISRDGMLTGVNIEATAHMGDMTGLHVIASGGVANLADIKALKAHEHFNIEGVVVGQAIYGGSLSLGDAITVGHSRLRRRSAGIVPFRWNEGAAEFLLIYNTFFEQWQFPRGGVKRREGDLDCAVRKFREETGLSIKELHETCRSELHYKATIRDCSIERTIIYYLAEAEDGEIVLGDENHCEARWQNATQTWELLTETSPEQLPALEEALSFFRNRG